MESFTLNEDETTFDIQVNGITVDSKKDAVTILFDWEYKEKTFNVHDSGTGEAKSKNLHITVVFKLESTSSIRVTDCTLQLKDFGWYFVNFYCFFLIKFYFFL